MIETSFPRPTKDYMVVIKCFTYNHGAYIEDALKGFVMQKTNFPFCALVVDDFSTDNTADIIRKYETEYPEIIKGVYLQENYYSQGGRKREKTDIVSPWFDRCKYIALCEGDDYWTDPLKLQTQVDFLETHTEYGMCYTQAKHFYQEQGRFRSKVRGGNHETFHEFLKKNTVPTLTALFKKQLYRNYLNEVEPGIRNWRMGDYPMWLWFSLNSKIKFFPIVTGVYRILPNSASHSHQFESSVAFLTSTFDIKYFFLERNPQDGISLDDLKQQQYQQLFSLAFLYKEETSLKCYYKKIKKRTFKMHIKYWIRRHFW